MEKTTEARKVAPKKGTKTTELIIGAAANKLSTAVLQMNTAIGEVTKLQQLAQDNTIIIVDLEDKIGALKQELENQMAQNKLNLELAFKSNKALFAAEWMSENNLASISTFELHNLKVDLENATSKMEDTVKREVGIITSRMKSEHENEKKVLMLEHEKKEANNLAELNQLRTQVTMWKEQADMWQKALDAERQAGIERAKASSIGTLNIGGTTQGR
jgi:hypothetical protein